MTKDELRKHCEKTVETQLLYKNSTNGLEQFHSKKVLSEHQLILELLDADAKWLSVMEKITQTMEVESENADELADWFSDGDKMEASFRRGQASGIKWVKGIIDKAIKECES